MPDEKLEDFNSRVFEIYFSKYPGTIHTIEDADYFIGDDEILDYDWENQAITFDEDILNRYETNNDYLSHRSSFGIVWNGEIVATGQIIEHQTPITVPCPVMYVLHSARFPQYYSSDRQLKILLKADRQGRWISNVAEYGETFHFSPEVSEEIREYFLKTDRLTQ